MKAVGLVLAGERQEQLSAATPDALCVLNGLPLVAYAVRALALCDKVDQVVVSAATESVEDIGVALDRNDLNHHVTVVDGGLDLPLLQETCGAVDVVVIHDIHRPLASTRLVDRVLTAMCDGLDAGVDVVVPVVEVVETVKELDADGRVVRTVPRELLRQVQTPRAVRAAALSDAMLGDEAAWESFVRSSSRVLTVAGEAEAFALREPADLDLAAALLVTGREESALVGPQPG